MARTVLLAQDPAFSIGEPRLGRPRATLAASRRSRSPAARSRRRSSISPGPEGRAPDGLADVDELGRFATSGAGALALPRLRRRRRRPIAETPRSATRRAARSRQRARLRVHRRVARRTSPSLTRDLVPLLEPDPKRQHETVMDLLGGFTVVAGSAQRGQGSARDRTTATGRSTAASARRRRRCSISSTRVGQVLAEPTTEDTLALLQRLAQDKPQVLARLVGVGLEGQGDRRHSIPRRKLPGDSTLWDEMLDVLVEDLAEAEARRGHHPRVRRRRARSTSPRPAPRTWRCATSSPTTGTTSTAPPFNITTGKVGDARHAGRSQQARHGLNRSAFQRFLQTLHDANGLASARSPAPSRTSSGTASRSTSRASPSKAACFTLGADRPPNPMPLCGMFRIKNIAHELVNAVLGKVKLDIRDDCLKKLVELAAHRHRRRRRRVPRETSRASRGSTRSPRCPGIRPHRVLRSPARRHARRHAEPEDARTS